MEGLLDRASPRRGSLTSLHRYPSGSFSSNTKQSSPSNTLQINSTNLYALCKDLDKFTRYFIVKAVQVIVQSRLNSGQQRIKSDCKPSGNDWFNLNISDIVDLSDKTKSLLDTEGLSVKANWRVCCEISLRTSDGGRVVLEYWIISNKTNFNSNQKLNNDSASSKNTYIAGKSIANHLTSSNISNGSGSSPLGVINSSGRTRPATFTSSSRTRLNSIDDGDNNGLTTNKYALNENTDIKPSASCFSLSSAQASHHHHHDGINAITESPSANSISINAAASSTNAHDQQQQQPLANTNHNSNNATTTNNSSSMSQSQNYTNKSSATSSIYTIYNRMSLLLKTLLTTAHIVPAYRLASQSSQTDSCVISYRIYAVPRHTSTSRGSVEDINLNYHQDSPNRRSQTSTSSLGSIDIREFVNSDELDHFSPILKLGSIKTDINELDVSLCYRTDTRNASYSSKNPRSRDMYNRLLDEDCLVAAKQLLAGNVGAKDAKHLREHMKSGSNSSLDRDKLAFLDQPLRPAFASSYENGESKDKIQSDRPSNGEMGDCTLIESAFERLLQNRTASSSSTNKDDDIVNIANEAMKSPTKSSHEVSNGKKVNNNAKSTPIQVPGRTNQLNNLISSPSSTPKSLSDSYVFVDLNPPFASDEQNDMNSFFHGPTPTFANGLGSLKDVEDLTSQLAAIEANADQIDEFVDNICVSEDDEESEQR